MHYENIRISDNITLLSVNTDKFKTAAIRISVALPLSRRAFILSRLLCGMLGRGTEKYPSLELLNKRLDDLYASCVSVNSTVTENLIILNISADLLDPRFVPDGTDILGEVLAVVKQMLFSPLLCNGVFPEDKLEHEKRLLKDSYLAKKNDSRAYAAIRAEEQRRRNDTSFATIEYIIESTDSVTAEELTGFYLDILTYSPWRAIYVGSETAESVAAKLCEAFNPLVGKQSISFLPSRHYGRAVCHTTENMQLNQSRLALGFCTEAPVSCDIYDALSVMSIIFGGTPASKLFLNVREKLGLCYSCGSSFSSITGYLNVSAGINAKNRELTQDEIFRQLDGIKSGSISDTELFAARKYIEFSFDQVYDSPFGIVSFYASKEHLGRFETPEERKSALLGVSKEQITNAARLLRLDSIYFLCGTLSESGGECLE